ncbi:MAG: CDP-diacylglycerol--glycerol-3-phosphate 3-phosphatidyltransferase [Inquilinus sp.]|nr:CDP-diacylglycerol--glycerol-3-phosphate 3-phosphatidyltransferase [Inquilinus sp.]
MLRANLTSLPNLLTMSRIACIPIIVVLFYIPFGWAAWVACAVFTAAAITDFLDGYFARELAEVSSLGKLLDPIADKMLVASILLMLVGFGRLEGLSIIPALVILLREIMISGLREYLAGFGSTGLPVTTLAKWKTGVQMTALGFLIVGDAGPGWLPVTLIGVLLIWAASALTLVTGWQYVREGVRQMLSEKTPAPKAKRPPRKGTAKRPSTGATGTAG